MYLAHPLREVSIPPVSKPREEPITVGAGDLGIIGKAPAIIALRSLIRRVAPSHAPVLVLGESGTGKELVARAVHACGRSAAPFVAVNAATLRGPLFQSECFGHERGAFTGGLDRSLLSHAAMCRPRLLQSTATTSRALRARPATSSFLRSRPS